ncbi:MAG: hypothetical protein JNK15_14205 [Planctomycetes bacterium]|nr:hypothetical protein [Planctomycetota bacterium]
MPRFVRIALAAVVVWQAAATAIELGRRVVAAGDAGVGWSFRLDATTTERVQRVLGDDAALLRELPERVPPGTVVLNRQFVVTPEMLARLQAGGVSQAEFERLAARNGLFLQLTALLFPRPFLRSVPDPIALAELEAKPGQDLWLFVLQGDPEPEGRPGWQCSHRAAKWTLWRLSKAS